MASQIDLLKTDIARLEAKHGPDDPYVKDLRQQLASMESQAEKKHSPNPVTLHVGLRSK